MRRLSTSRHRLVLVGRANPPSPRSDASFGPATCLRKDCKNRDKLAVPSSLSPRVRKRWCCRLMLYPDDYQRVVQKTCKLLRRSWRACAGEKVRPRSSFKSGLLLTVLLAAAVCAEQDNRPSDAELIAITERGRALAAYDQAAWHATDAVQTANPKTTEGQHYLARFANERWTVVFGYLDSDKTKFLITYEAAQGNKLQSFNVTHDDPPKEDTGFYLFAARALEIALTDFGRAPRPYRAAVLLAADSQLYVYLYPDQLKAGTYPLGGDVRYLISPDGQKILEKRPLHKTIIEAARGKGKKATAGFHTHVLSDVPEDTDVLHVLRQDPPLPEMIGTPNFLYEITADGSVRIKQKKRK